MSYAPMRVVSLQPSATVILRDLGKLDALVACTKYCVEVCPEIGERNITVVADSWTAQAQQISETKPDLVIASVPYQEKAIAEIMKSGARFLGLAPRSLADIYGDIAAIAGIVAQTPAGALVGTTTKVIPANGNAAVAVGGALGGSGSGGVQIAHDALPGSVVANITSLSAATGLSFDSPAFPRMWSSIFGS